MSARAEPPPGKGTVPRDAASLVIVDRRADGLFILLGKRRATQAFAPGKYVFPGGGLDAADSALARVPGLRVAEHDRPALIHAPGPASQAIAPEAFALAAIRETFEETGLALGQPSPLGTTDLAEAPPAWAPFLALGLAPNPGALSFIARAITPPDRPKRFDARFFLADASAIAREVAANDGEFDHVGWFALADALELDLHGMTRQIIGDAQRHLARSVQERRQAPVPFYFQAADGWQMQPIVRGFTASTA